MSSGMKFRSVDCRCVCLWLGSCATVSGDTRSFDRFQEQTPAATSERDYRWGGYSLHVTRRRLAYARLWLITHQRVESHVNDFPIVAEPKMLSVVGVEIVHPDKVQNHRVSRDQPLKSPKNHKQ